MSGYVYGIPRSAARRPPRWPNLAGALAAAAGHAARAGRQAAVRLPGLAGSVAVCYGAWLAWAPAGFLAAGAFLLLLDRRVP
jgi:hypothetical protein